MRTFKEFPEESKCPICGTNKNKECFLMPIVGTQRGNCCEAQPTHLECLKEHANRFVMVRGKTSFLYMNLQEE